jgi:hyaluronoglucosaminidase
MTRGPARGRSPAPLRALGLALVIALIGLVAGDALDPPSAPAASPFQWRGVIQGQYGRQFGPGERRRLLWFMARNGFNAYVQAPKGDPYQRTLWRDPYPADRQATFDSEVQLAASLGIEWIPNVSPGIPAWSSPGEAAPPGTAPSEPICFSSEADLRQLLLKLEPFRAAGAHTFMVSFDDVLRRRRLRLRGR